MQDHHFDELREALGAQQGEGFEEKLSHMLNNKVGDDLDDEERDRREREYYRSNGTATLRPSWCHAMVAVT